MKFTEREQQWAQALRAADHKRVRAAVILEHLMEARQVPAGVVCFSCGNAAHALQAVGLDVLHVGPRGELQPRAWWTPAQIRHAWPLRFDATSGHLCVPLMVDIAARLRRQVHAEVDYGMRLLVPSGSGETAVCVALAWPEHVVVAQYDDNSSATTWHPQAPLNALVERLCVVERVTMGERQEQ